VPVATLGTCVAKASLTGRTSPLNLTRFCAKFHVQQDKSSFAQGIMGEGKRRSPTDSRER
jgi:hypothetical protein